jgi:NAD(P)-dependent dehydrogenase (short-subunit alcohol dehydrogenase family)
MPSHLKDKVVLISGASGGLGQAVTEAFLDAGALVAGVSRNWPPKASNTPRFLPVAADLTQEAGCIAAVQAALERWPRLDAAVHLMGGFAAGTTVEATPVEVWDRMMNLNLRSAFLFFRAALPPMLKAGRGRLLAVGSRPGVDPAAGLGAYAVSKAGLHALVRTLAAEHNDGGITANAVLPSVIDTPANRAAMPDADVSKWVAPESIAALLVFLAGDAAQDITGALVPIYGRS